MTEDGTYQKRTKLIAARLERGLEQRDVANAICYSVDAVSEWERGVADPQKKAIAALCTFYGKTPIELDLARDLSESELAMLQEILKNKKVDRRQAFAIIALPAFAEVDFSALTKPLVSPAAFLNQCSAAIAGCWSLLNSGEYAKVENILTANISPLTSLAGESKYQAEASSLLTQAKIMQIQLATRNCNFASRKTLGVEAVEFGELSEDPFLHVEALYWDGDTYVYCYQNPRKAIDITEDALSRLPYDALLSKTALYSNLAIARAQQGNESLAIKMAEQARKVLPSRPELDPVYRYGGWSDATLGKFEGRVYLALAEHFPGHAKTAYDTFNEAAGKYTHQVGLSQTLIHQADAARLRGNLDDYARCLEKGWLIAREIDSLRRQHQARTVLNKAPQKWKNEDKYQNLVKMF